MTDEPTYPKDAAVGIGAAAQGGETLGVVVSAKETDPAKGGQQWIGKNTRNLVAGAAIGVGSAALVAALLYANRSRRSDPEPARTIDPIDAVD